MYEKFFGFREKPFKLVPNPAYLFLSRNHEEVLAHLTYAANQEEGFVAIIGEVGTGKTTLCRSFLESIDAHTEAAFIFNPPLNAVRLLQAVNDEFGISADTDDAKVLTDALNAFLLRNKASNKNVILLIDEAQNLSRDVLEQLRLISNLETTRHKLLQIILVGQPELGEVLDSYDLRQLGQRIALRCLLRPLTHHETRSYIGHRIRIASLNGQPRFSRAALGRIFRYSQGIPRLINIVCDRSLLIAFGLNRHTISSRIAKLAVRELTARSGSRRTGYPASNRVVLACSIGCLVLAALTLLPSSLIDTRTALDAVDSWKSQSSRENSPGNARPGALVATEMHSKAVVSPPKKTMTGAMLEKFLDGMTTRHSRRTALDAVLNLWQPESDIDTRLDELDDNPTYFRVAAKQHGLKIRRIQKGLLLVERLNLPAILECFSPGTPLPKYVALTQMTRDAVILSIGKNQYHMTPDELVKFWSGVTYLPWKDFLQISGTPPVEASPDTIIALKMLLRNIGFSRIDISPIYDNPTRDAVEKIQEKYGISVDGIVGSTTKIALYNERKIFTMPHIAVVGKQAERN